MTPPLICYIAFNRLELTVKNLSSLLSGTEDFDLHITDNNSKDDSWEYIQSLDDSRIKSKERLEINQGLVYALNMNLSKRMPDQYFFATGSGALIETGNWIQRFMNIFDAFPETGLLGAIVRNEYLPPVNLKTNGFQSYLELTDNKADIVKNRIPGCLMALKPELIREIGFFCEESCYGDIELTYRVCNHTQFKAGFVPDVSVIRPQAAACTQCAYVQSCKLDKAALTCSVLFDKYNKNEEFLRAFEWKFEETARDLSSGTRPVYCTSLFEQSYKDHVYNMDWSLENFLYFLKYAN
jgi:glycosyltransferase involved in cell wall biosynthesis